MVRALAAGLLTIFTSGCFQLTFDREREGRLEPYILAQRLEEGRSTQAEALALLGSPDFLLKPDNLDAERVYYSYWDRGGFRFIFRINIPIGDLSASYDVFVLAFAREKLWLVRLDFDRNGVLMSKLVSKIDQDGSGYYTAIDNNVVVNYLEDRRRALGVQETEDIDDDDYDEDETAAKPPASTSGK